MFFWVREIGIASAALTTGANGQSSSVIRKEEKDEVVCCPLYTVFAVSPKEPITKWQAPPMAFLTPLEVRTN